MNKKVVLIASSVTLCIAASVYYITTYTNLSSTHKVGDVIDELNGVKVFHNGGIHNTVGRHLAPDGYNLGIKYQCVEFVKRYYYIRFRHKMPDAYGHAKHFYDTNIPDGGVNSKRGLTQFNNGGTRKPQADDILIWGPSITNPFGHVAIIAKVDAENVEVIQQNPGPWAPTRERLRLLNNNGLWRIDNSRVKGWLRIRP